MNKPKERNVMWAPAEGVGLEHLKLTIERDGAVAGGLVIGTKYGFPFRAHYVVRLDSEWRTQDVRVMVLGSDEPPLTLLSDGEGHWQRGDGSPVPKLDGAIDVDLAITPFTNTLPIRRLGLELGQSAEIKVAWMDLPHWRLELGTQRYTRIDIDTYRFESLPDGFTADLPVDEDGLVLDYPSLFRRVWER